MTFFEDEVAKRTAEAIARVYDPTKPPASPPMRTPWGDPDLRGYWLSLSYTPLERPEQFANKSLLTPQEAIEFFTEAVIADSAVDPATVHYDWKEFGMDMWQSPVRPNLRSGLIVDPADGKLPPLSPEGQKRRGGGCGEDHEPVVGGVAPDQFVHALHHGEPGAAQASVQP